MRKADYQLLTTILSAEIYHAKCELAQANRTSDTHSATLYSGRVECATRIAEIFAKRASVDARQFLIACGITPT